MKIVIFDAEPWEEAVFSRLRQYNEVVFVGDPLSKRNVRSFADADVISVPAGCRLSKDILQQFAHLRLISTQSTGYDHIDVKYCAVHEILVANVPGYASETVAEHAFGLLLLMSHHLYEAVHRTRSGDFSHHGLRGFDLAGKALGIIGTGAIGQSMIRIAHGFGMEVLAYDVNPKPDLAAELSFTYHDIDSVLSTSDVISLHVPAMPETRHLISQREFDLMKTGVVLINTARGQVLDVAALLVALQSGKVSAVGLDVLPQEIVVGDEEQLVEVIQSGSNDLRTLLVDCVLLRQDNVYVTPHSGYNTHEAMQRILETTVENIESFVSNRPTHVVVP